MCAEENDGRRTNIDRVNRSADVKTTILNKEMSNK